MQVELPAEPITIKKPRTTKSKTSGPSSKAPKKTATGMFLLSMLFYLLSNLILYDFL